MEEEITLSELNSNGDIITAQAMDGMHINAIGKSYPVLFNGDQHRPIGTAQIVGVLHDSTKIELSIHDKGVKELIKERSHTIMDFSMLVRESHEVDGVKHIDEVDLLSVCVMPKRGESGRT